MGSIEGILSFFAQKLFLNHQPLGQKVWGGSELNFLTVIDKGSESGHRESDSFTAVLYISIHLFISGLDPKLLDALVV